MLSDRIPSGVAPNAWTRALATRRAAGLPVLDLTEANPTRTGLAPLAEAAAALAAVGPLDYTPEPRGSASAREAVAASLADRGVGVDPGRIVLTCGTSEGYAHLFRLLANPGGTVLAPTPSYPLFEPLARAEGVSLRTYPLRYDGAWHLDRDAFAEAAPGARAVIVVEPNHPTGSCLDAEDRAFLAAEAARHGAAVIADEVFGDHPLPEAAGPLPTWLAERDVPTFVLGGLSKRCGLPQLKLGWIVATGPEARAREALGGLEWLADLYLSVGSPVQAALPSLLALRHAFAARVRDRAVANLAALDALVRVHPACTRLPVAGGWTALLRLPATRTDEGWALALLVHGVAVHPGHFYDLAGGEFLALSLVVERGVFAEGCRILSRLLAKG